MTKQQAVIFDLDNCLSDDRARIPLIDWSKEDPDERYAEYHARCLEDPVNPFAHNQLTKFKEEGAQIFFFTARPTSVYGKTMEWLFKHFPGLDSFSLKMRAVGDKRSSVEIKREMTESCLKIGLVICFAYDDREDIIKMYRSLGICAYQHKCHDLDAFSPPAKRVNAAFNPQDFLREPVASWTAADSLQNMAQTYREKNAGYKDNFRTVGAVMAALYPDGVRLSGAEQFERWHLFELAVVKMTRFVNSGMTHEDSIHDMAIYCAMVEALTNDDTTKIEPEGAKNEV